MKWTRDPETPAAYVAGPYRVEQIDTLPTTPRQRTPGKAWRVTGPDGVDTTRRTKAEAQSLAFDYATARLQGDGARTATPVVGDWAYIGEYCRVTAVFTGGTGNPVYVLLTPRKKRRCLSRYEFPLVLR